MVVTRGKKNAQATADNNDNSETPSKPNASKTTPSSSAKDKRAAEVKSLSNEPTSDAPKPVSKKAARKKKKADAKSQPQQEQDPSPPASIDTPAPAKKKRKISEQQVDDDSLDAEDEMPGSSTVQTQLGAASTPSGKPKKVGSRKGASRNKANAAEKPDTMGDRNKIATFLSIEGNEQKLAAYLGFNNTTDLRIVMSTWPVLKAANAFAPIAQNLNRKSAFHLICDTEDSIRNEQDPSKTWMANPKDSASVEKSKKDHLLARLLLDMEDDLENMKKGLSLTANIEMQVIHSASYAERTECTVASIFYAGDTKAQLLDAKSTSPQPSSSTPKDVRLQAKYPTLRRSGEDRLEAINRCWNLIKHDRYCHQAGTWAKRHSGENIQNGQTVDISHVPTWMKPPPKACDLVGLAKSKDVTEADHLLPKTFTIKWDKEANFLGKWDLDQALKDAKERNVLIPEATTQAKTDPRVCMDAGQFRDSIRRQYNCQDVLMQIHRMEATYNNSTANLQELEWGECLAIFNEPGNVEFTITVVFKAQDDPDESIYENF